MACIFSPLDAMVVEDGRDSEDALPVDTKPTVIRVCNVCLAGKDAGQHDLEPACRAYVGK